ncbi:porin [Azohydromonas lata]|uniref:porin n=1 Tax=Azohydromonas lata TaxID=45677 RepID=UPI00082FA84D|nr:porin [Azohydromonas lata]
MKKSLIALATLGAFAGAASAQSSVTLYGLVDLSVQHVKSGDLSPNAGKSLTKLADGVEWGPGSRWGLRVSEDLGSGLKANVVLESGFAADTGASTQGNRLFGRQAFISLASTSAGEVRLGRQYTFNDETVALNNPFGNTMFLHTGVKYTVVGGGLPLFIDSPRIDNALQYISPSFGGFRLQGMYGFDEKAQDRYYGLKAVYANGPLNVALAYEQNKLLTAVAGEDKANKTWTLGANYDFGMARVYAGFQQGKDLANSASSGNVLQSGGTLTADKLRTWTVGVGVPVGAFTIGANYVRAKYDDATGVVVGDKTIGRAAVGATYSLSKTTTLFTAYQQATGDLKDNVNEKRGVEIGLRKAF